MGFDLHHVVDDHGKKRLVDAVDIASAILLLSAKGVPAEYLLSEMMKMFYVDLDQYDAVMHGVAVPESRPPITQVAA